MLIIIFATSNWGCSTKKNTFLSRSYHNLTAHYNVYFNGNESYKKGLKKMNQSHRDDFTTLLPVFIYPGTEAANNVSSDMDRAIKKASKTIVLHSITAKPNYKKGIKTEKQKELYNKREYNKWIDDAYLLMGKAYLVKGELNYVNNTLRQIIKEYPSENTFTEAQLLLARKLILENEFTESGEILQSLAKNKKFPKKHVSLLNAIYAEYFIARKQFDLAAQKLEIAAQTASKKQQRLRYTFILAQLYQQLGQFRKATEKYEKVIKMNPPYEMTFNTKINLANVYEKGKGNADNIRQKLYKLLADEKNNEYQDQIYYALANIYMVENNKEKAIENYKLSTAKSVNNQQQKAKSYLAIADIYYNDRNYLWAQAYYDSALVNLNEKYTDYDKISVRSRSLTRLAKSLNAVTFEDSIQFVAQMSENERNMFIDKIIEQVKKQEAEEARRQQEEMMEQQSNMMAYNEYQSRNITSTVTNTGGQWYFYNMSARSSGEAEFKLKWGTRKLEDNWRRINKKSSSFTGEEAQDMDEQSAEEAKKEKQKGLSNKSREYYLVDLPLTDSAMQASHDRIIRNLMNSASIYRNELSEYQLAANQYYEIVKRYPEREEAAEAMYHLYILYMQLNKRDKADEYKNKLLSQFSNSMYARMLANPNFIKELQEKERQISLAYESTYRAYTNGNVQQALQLCNEGIKNNPDHPIYTKYLFLRALCRGQIFGADSLRNDLVLFVRNYPNVDETPAAKDMLAMLDEYKPEIIETASRAIARTIYQVPHENDTHFAVFVVDPKLGNTNQLNFNLINFNLDAFPQSDFNTKIEPLGAKNQMVVVRLFKSKTEAMNYYTTVSNSFNTILNDVGKINSSFVISEANFALLLKDGDENLYVAFFNENYK